MFQIIAENLWIRSAAELKNVSKTVITRIVAFHIVYRKASQRLQNFSHITSVWSECSENIMDFIKKPEASSVISESDMVRNRLKCIYDQY